MSALRPLSQMCGALHLHHPFSATPDSTHARRTNETPFDRHTALHLLGPSSTFSLLYSHAFFVSTVAATLTAVGPSSLFTHFPQVNVGEMITGVSETFLGTQAFTSWEV